MCLQCFAIMKDILNQLMKAFSFKKESTSASKIMWKTKCNQYILIYVKSYKVERFNNWNLPSKPQAWQLAIGKYSRFQYQQLSIPLDGHPFHPQAMPWPVNSPPLFNTIAYSRYGQAKSPFKIQEKIIW